MRSIRLLAGLLLMTSAGAFAAETLRVMTFNVRYPAKSDGPNIWEERRDLLVDTIKKHHPDVIGTQELFQLQGDYIVAKAPQYAWFGIGRRGDHTDEHMGVFYLKDRLELLDSGNFWLSETPEQPGSSAWDMSLPRMVTWGDFRDRKSGATFRFYNTHFPHRREDEEARTKCARVIADRIQADAKQNVILTGDFNTGLGSEAHKLLTAGLKDPWGPEATGPAGTFHGFKGTPRAGRIDWILFRGGFIPRSVQTLDDHVDGRYPSDHFPVLAVFGIGAEQP
jgi:endonuclease/exonuclease/phosphatase family metal-dependent hydrolase